MLSISIHSLHVEGDGAIDSLQDVRDDISIHSLHVEGDCGSTENSLVFDISIHSLHVEGDSYRTLTIVS